MIILKNSDIHNLATEAGQRICQGNDGSRIIQAFPIPRGGVPAAFAIASATYGMVQVVDDPHKADIYVDDIVDSGATARRVKEQYGEKPLFALIDKKRDAFRDEWVVFPWEGDSGASIDDNIVRLLEFVGEDPNREGLRETPRRVAKAWQQWCSGYGVDPKDVVKTFEDGASGVDELVLVRDIPIYSHCEHHLAPIFGTASIGYIPNGRIIGLSKLARLADVFARRLQVQERLTNQIATTLNDLLHPLGVGVVIKARHLCMESRGVCQQGHITVTSALRGVIKEKPESRAEFLDLTR